jgi:hypothetical protein
MTCAVDGCENKIKAKNLCDKHLQRLYRTGSIHIKTNIVDMVKCVKPDCKREAVKRGLCNEHLYIFKLPVT